ncbi:hypothetical protein Y1Q_0011633 [Alligator mississippiensis]|uniref:Uncharacterized protein n=1 Tax=Alligator mississippiensis TaxID=8496 RepID=A0A151M0M8_ALLMI|nr:hypothetical protein Y1Q_0011633 [Alligator mississippiensis]
MLSALFSLVAQAGSGVSSPPFSPGQPCRVLAQSYGLSLLPCSIPCDSPQTLAFQLPMMQDLDQTPTLEDVEKAIKETAPGKAAGNDQIPLELQQYAFGNDQSGILIESRMDGSLFNIRRFQSKRHATQLTVQDLVFTDAAAFIANDSSHLMSYRS